VVVATIIGPSCCSASPQPAAINEATMIAAAIFLMLASFPLFQI
jgi:hypothetical protein